MQIQLIYHIQFLGSLFQKGTEKESKRVRDLANESYMGLIYLTWDR